MTRDALLVAHARIHAARLELVVVRERGIELALRALEVLLRRRELPVLARLELLLVVGLGRLRGAVDGAVRGEGLVLLRGALLRCGRVALEAREVRRDHLEHADDAAALGLLALEGGVEGLRRVVHRGRLLHERRRLRGLGVELLQHPERRLHRLLSRLCVRNRCLVLRLLLRANLRRLRNRSVKLRDLLGQVRELLGQLRNVRGELVRLGREGVHVLGLRLALDLVRAELAIAPALVLSLLIRLLHELDDHILDHLLHLDEGVRSRVLSQKRQHLRVELISLRRKELRNLALVLRHGRRAEREGRPLDERRKVLVRRSRNGLAGDDLDRLLDGLELLRPQLLALLEVRALLLAPGNGVVQVLLVFVAGCRGVLQLTFRGRGVLLALGLPLGLAAELFLQLLDRVLKLLHQHLVRVLRVHLLLLEVVAHVLELGLELLEHLHDARGLELVGVRLRRRDAEASRRRRGGGLEESVENAARVRGDVALLRDGLQEHHGL